MFQKSLNFKAVAIFLLALQSCSQNSSNVETLRNSSQAANNVALSLENVAGTTYIMPIFEGSKSVYKVNLTKNGFAQIETKQGSRKVKIAKSDAITTLTLVEKLYIEDTRKFKQEGKKGKYLVTCLIEKIEIRKTVTGDATVEFRSCEVDPAAGEAPFKEIHTSLKPQYTYSFVDSNNSGLGTILTHTGLKQVDWNLTNSVLTLNIDDQNPDEGYMLLETDSGEKDQFFVNCKLAKIEINISTDSSPSKTKEIESCQVNEESLKDSQQSLPKEMKFTNEFTSSDTKFVKSFPQFDMIQSGMTVALPSENGKTLLVNLNEKNEAVVVENSSNIENLKQNDKLKYNLSVDGESFNLVLNEKRTINYKFLETSDEAFRLVVTEIRDRVEFKISNIKAIVIDNSIATTMESFAGKYQAIYDDVLTATVFEFLKDGTASQYQDGGLVRVSSWNVENDVVKMVSYDESVVKDSNGVKVFSKENFDKCNAQPSSCRLNQTRTLKIVKNQFDVSVMYRVLVYRDNEKVTDLMTYKKIQ